MSNVIWSVSYWVEAERMWQFAGEGDREWALARRDLLVARGHKARIRWRHAVVVDPVVEQRMADELFDRTDSDLEP